MNQLPDPLKAMAAVGTVCLQFSLLELTIAHIIWAFLDFDEDTGAVVTGGLDMLPRINMAINLAEVKNAPPPIKKGLRSIRKKLQDGLLDRRNQAVHAAHRTTGVNSEMFMLRWPKEKRYQSVSVGSLHDLAQQLNDLAQDTHRIFNDVGKWRFPDHGREDASGRVTS